MSEFNNTTSFNENDGSHRRNPCIQRINNVLGNIIAGPIFNEIEKSIINTAEMSLALYDGGVKKIEGNTNQPGLKIIQAGSLTTLAEIIPEIVDTNPEVPILAQFDIDGVFIPSTPSNGNLINNPSIQSIKPFKSMNTMVDLLDIKGLNALRKNLPLINLITAVSDRRNWLPNMQLLTNILKDLEISFFPDFRRGRNDNKFNWQQFDNFSRHIKSWLKGLEIGAIDKITTLHIADTCHPIRFFSGYDKTGGEAVLPLKISKNILQEYLPGVAIDAYLAYINPFFEIPKKFDSKKKCFVPIG